ncbi:hypothetical protein QIS74_13738, partial [Colletotrichum tabaci]
LGNKTPLCFDDAIKYELRFKLALPFSAPLFPKTDPVIDGDDFDHECESCHFKYPNGFNSDETDELKRAKDQEKGFASAPENDSKKEAVRSFIMACYFCVPSEPQVQDNAEPGI